MERVKQFTRVPCRDATTRKHIGYVGVLFVYDEADPYSITARFPQGRVWTWSRDMTYLGLRADKDRPLGVGDVQIHREVGSLCITLRGPEGSVTMLVPADDFETFLDSTYVLVPAGKEDIDVDSWIKELLA